MVLIQKILNDHSPLPCRPSETETAHKENGNANAMMLIDLNDQNIWETDDGGASYFAQVPFRHPNLPKSELLTVAVNCKDAAFGPMDRRHAQRCLDSLNRRVDDMIARMMAFLKLGPGARFEVERSMTTLLLFAGDHAYSNLAVYQTESGSTICAEWDGETLTRVWGEEDGSPEPAWQVSEGLREQPQAGCNRQSDQKPITNACTPGKSDLHSLNNKVGELLEQRRYDSATELAQKALKIAGQSPEPDKRALALSLNNLAYLHYAQGQFKQAEPYYRRALALVEETHGPDHILVSALQNNLASLYFDMGQYALAEPLYKRSLEIREKALSPFHPDVLQSIDCLAAVYRQTGRIPDAMAMEQRAAALRAIN